MITVKINGKIKILEKIPQVKEKHVIQFILSKFYLPVNLPMNLPYEFTFEL